MTNYIYINTVVQGKTQCFANWNILKNHETHNDHPYTCGFYPPKLFTLQSSNILVFMYAVHLFHSETINI